MKEARIENGSVVTAVIKGQIRTGANTSVPPKGPAVSADAITPHIAPSNRDVGGSRGGRLNEDVEDPLPSSYVQRLSGRKEPAEQKDGRQSMPAPSPLQQGAVAVRPEFIFTLTKNPLLESYTEDLLQSPERIRACLQNKKIQLILAAFAGGDPMLEANFKKEHQLRLMVEASLN